MDHRRFVGGRTLSARITRVLEHLLGHKATPLRHF